MTEQATLRSRLFQAAVVLLAAAAARAGFMASRAEAEVMPFCPGTDYCYNENGCKACKTYLCASLCPDPGQQGSRCYVCASKT